MKILIIAYFFPPESSSGSFRPMYFAKHLYDQGCHIDVLTASVSDYLEEQPIDHSMSELLDKSISVERCSVYRPRERLIALKNKISFQKKSIEHSISGPIAHQKAGSNIFKNFKDFITDLLAIPDAHNGWLPACVIHGRKIIKNKGNQIIFATGNPWTGLLAGVLLKKISGVPLILDFRDPWVSNPNLYQKPWLTRFLNRILERSVVHSCDYLIANTKKLEDDFIARYGEALRGKIATITNGFECYLQPAPAQSEKMTITHAGALYFSRNPINLLLAIVELVNKTIIDKDKIILNLVDGISIDDKRIDQLLATEPCKSIVNVINRVSFNEAQAYMMNSDLLLIIQPEFPLQVPRKIYDYMSVKKPVFGICEKNSATHQMIEEYNLGFCCEDDQTELKKNLASAYITWSEGNLSEFVGSKCDEFLNINLAQKLHNVCNGILRKRHAS